MKMRSAVLVLLVFALIGLCVSCDRSETPAPPPRSPPQPGQAAPPPAPESPPGRNPDRNAYFGEEHIHTSWSVDAWVMGNRLTGPGEALKYAQGETLKHPMGFDIKIDTPMDFMGVTDHSEYVGVTKQANIPGSAVSKIPEAKPLILTNPNDPAEQNRVFLYLLTLTSKPPIKAFMTPEVAGTVWKENVKLADENNHPGKFTAFCAYEWTSLPNNRNLHRNIFFRDCSKVPEMPFSSMDNNHPEELWKWMDAQRKAGNELLAISHNANLSDGWMYPVDVDSLGRPIDAAWASARERNERLVEIVQIKGQSETHPLLSPSDEFADYELFSALLGLPEGNGRIDHIHGSFARQAYKDGITMQDTRGYNPYKFGMAAGSDSHNTGSPYRQDNFYGGHGEADGTVERRMAGVLLGSSIDVRLENPGGLTGVWAEENTRASIWDAMYRKETFGVSGPHIKVRFFGGWAYGKGALDARDWVHQAYAQGVPMGADLPPPKGVAPTFVVWAVKDPSSANLDRIQIIKGWTKNGQSFEKIYDVVWSGDRKPDRWSGRVPPVQSTVDLDKATYSNSMGSTELKAVWTDPEFDAGLHAFYYARVLEIPTPRWTLIQAVKAGLPPPDVVPLTGQERAWTSPIWYTPSAEARKATPAGTKVDELKQRGAIALGDAQLKALVVGKNFWLRNNASGEQFSVSFTTEGQTNVWHVGTNASMPSSVGHPVRSGYEGTTTPYRIENGKLVTSIYQEPSSATFYKLKDIYYVARSNEFGYANYEIVPTPQFASNPLTALIAQFTLELGLNEQQKQQVIPILQKEITALEALKKNTALKPLQKIEQLRRISSSIDDQISPFLDPAQRQKFQVLREEARRRLLEKIAGKVVEKVKEEIYRIW